MDPRVGARICRKKNHVICTVKQAIAVRLTPGRAVLTVSPGPRPRSVNDWPPQALESLAALGRL